MKLTFITTLILNTSFLFSQNTGLPFIRNYSPTEYRGYSQNWAAEQDNRGVMYFGNGKGILEYNGKSWRRFFTKKTTTVLSMCKDKKGRIFIGAENEIGYLKADSTGLVNFVSLDYLIPEEENNFSYVWQSYCNNEGVFFVTSEKIIKIDNNFKVKFIKPFTTFFTSFMINNQMFIQDTQKGLFKIIDDSLKQYTGWEKLVDLRAMFINDSNQYIGLSGRNGLISFSETKFPQKQIAEINSYKYLKYYKGVKLNNNYYAIATMLGGIIIIDINGKIIQEINLENGLIGSSVYSLFIDYEGELWAMLENGLSRIEVSSPFTIFDKRLGITGITQDIIKIKNELLVATTDGLYKLNQSKYLKNKFYSSNFSIFNNISGQTFSVANFNNYPVYCFIDGIFITQNFKNKLIYHDNYEICIENSKYYKNLLYYGGNNNFGFLKYEKNKWKHFNISKKINGDVYYIIEEQKNNFWASTVTNGIYKIKLLDTIDFTTKVTHFDSTNNLPNGMLEIKYINNEILVGSQSGIYQFNNKSNKFYLSKKYISDSSLYSKPIYNISEGIDSSIWLMLEKTVTKLTKKNDYYEKYDTPFKRLVFNDLYSIYPDSNDITWIGTTDCVYRYDANNKFNKNIKFSTIISNVTYNKDTVFKGCFIDATGLPTIIQPQWNKKEFKYSHNSFVFEFSAATYSKEENNLFSYFLEGFDDDWSDYSVVNKKEYTNLNEGKYIFHVKSKNIYGFEGVESTFEFSVLPPWYRTWWAYILYIVLFIILLYITITIYTKRLKAANIKLEKIVQQRTQEIRHQNQAILQQKEEILAQRDEIEAQRDLVTQQKNRIEEIHETLTSSIRYAKQIQNAALPSIKQLKEILGEYFIFFKPRDIVSGDFYWATKIKRWLIFCVADCTGHGVPGAFMSMLGISLLDEIVSKEEISNSSEILNSLRKNIISSLKQENIIFTDNKVKDGMDISLCVLDTETLKLQFSGANNPLYIVRSRQEAVSSILSANCQLSTADCSLFEVKGDKMPIAVYLHMEKFTLHEIQLNKGDLIYLFSDGYADQFGGINNKKFKYNALKELLLSNSQKSLDLQKIEIEKTFETWRGNYYQVDDVTVMGLKI